MRIILVGQAAFAEQVLQRFVDRGETVVAVYCPPDGSGAKQDPVKVRAGELGISVRQHRSLRRPEVVEEFRSTDADLAVLAFVTQIVPESVIEIPRFGTICFHPSLLPRYRGGSAINWQIIKGESHTGVTVFATDAGIDTGPIIVQKEAEIAPDATAGSLYYETLFPLGVEAVLEAVALIAEGRAPCIAQDERLATYDPLCRDEHAAVSWNRPVGEVYNLIRGCDPQPGAFAQIAGHKVRLYDAALETERGSVRPPKTGGTQTTGTVIGVSPDGLRIVARGGVIRIGRVRPEGEGAKIKAVDFARAARLEPGTQLVDSLSSS
jgi:methionyl-tRNA formyltransferase